MSPTLSPADGRAASADTPTFASLGLPEAITAALDRAGITSPFEIQAAAIPDALAGRDICGRAPTGSGKTLAFGLPVVSRVGRADTKAPRALVLAPTRELADQIRRELAPVAQAAGRRIAAVYGGVGIEPQRSRLAKGVDVLVACPGRLEDLLNQRALRLDQVDIVVIDEADRMADMGFLPAVRRLLDQTGVRRQTILFSATLDGDVAVLTRDYQHDPVRHEVGSTEPDISDMVHVFEDLERNARTNRAAHLVHEHGPTVVFTRTRHGADRVARQLSKAGVAAAAIHGGRSQGQRDRALSGFAEGRTQALVATDVAARGIHVDDVACVLHYDPPADDKTYLHRSGRTARAGARGHVVTFVTPETRRDVDGLRRSLGLDTGASTTGGDDRARSGGTTTEPAPKPGRNRNRNRGRKRPATADRASGNGERTRTSGERSGNGERASTGSERSGSGNRTRNGTRSGNRSRGGAETGRSRSGGGSAGRRARRRSR